MTTKPTRGLWIDDAPAAVMQAAYWEKLIDHGFGVAAVMLESVTTGFDPRYSAEQLEKLGKLARDHGAELVLTIWPEPRRKYLEELRVKLPTLVRAAKSGAVEFDAESNMTRSRLAGFASMDEAGDELIEVVEGVVGTFVGLDVRTELTTFTEHSENSRSAVLASKCDRVIGQGYSVRNRKDAKGKPFQVPWDHIYGPGGMQRRTFERSLQIPGAPTKPEIACGLAAYDQRWPGKTVAQAMTVAYEAALKYDPKEVRWWSSKWVIGARADRAVANFFLGLR